MYNLRGNVCVFIIMQMCDGFCFHSMCIEFSAWAVHVFQYVYMKISECILGGTFYIGSVAIATTSDQIIFVRLNRKSTKYYTS